MLRVLGKTFLWEVVIYVLDPCPLLTPAHLLFLVLWDKDGWDFVLIRPPKQPILVVPALGYYFFQ